ncbi:hypothetical protein SAMN02799631_01989 [Methylobacterium sp. 174MFSha1.1]|uniref:hypothetical protein n=1 Tax=Methylobacterium sp. 174MFSha1.1 TaxID=1502749 RepID=UPI0008E497B2|nr:hypothetical protein [Methylobacterium sp. 174MFSha1.1]SFU72547.1 hypothetical protein SAMN02799631_01989 [Methylobacterium sp. 174MFSha1.1]
MADSAPIDRAFQRSRVLARLVAEAREHATRNPGHDKWLDLGLTEVGDRPKDAVRKLERIFDEIAGLIEHLAILDMAASYERSARTRIGNYVGVLNAVGEAAVRRGGLPRHSLGLLRRATEYQDLASIIELLKPSLDADLLTDLQRVRRSRNSFAHGTDVSFGPDIDAEGARVVLKQAIDVV